MSLGTALMAEKSMLPSRFFLCLIALAMCLLIFSSTFLFRLNDNSFTPALFEIVDDYNSTEYFLSELRQLPYQPSDTDTISPSSDKSEISEEVVPQVTRVVKIDSLGYDKVKVCDPDHAILKVYMYDLPPEFHFGLMGWKGGLNQVWPDVSNISQIPRYPGGLNLQHSIAYWLTLDLLSSNSEEVLRPCTAIRVQNTNDADIIFVPFLSSLSYNRYSRHIKKRKDSIDRILQDKLVEFLKDQDEWKRSGGKDHLIVAHHPNSMLAARRELGSARFVLADFGRYPKTIANLQKDVIAPYQHVIKTTPANISAPFEDRPILVYFQGAIYRKDGGAIRQELYYLLKDEKDVHFSFGSVRANGINQAGRGMAASKFCLNIAGDTPSSNRLFDAIATHCVPVIISDDIELPFEDVLDYSEFCVFVRATDAVRKGYLLNLLRGIDREKWSKMWDRLKEIEKHFEYQFPSRPGDAVDMIWGVVSRKLSASYNEVYRKNRYNKTKLLLNTR
ncbi:putative arabinosyltransferase ARAD1 isoform X2 [Apium graveolens]